MSLESLEFLSFPDTTRGLIAEISAVMREISSRRSTSIDDQLHVLLGQLDGAAASMPAHQQTALRSHFLDATEPLMARSVVISHGRRKPLGYAGDFQMIDWTYLKHVGSADRAGAMLDEFYHAQVAPKAVCDRKSRFEAVLSDMARSKRYRPLSVLNVGSGPAREIIDGAAAAGLSPERLLVTCVEIDDRAISYAKAKVLGPLWAEAVEFWCGNAIRYRATRAFDLVWSAGLFDYLNDRLAIALLRRLWGAVAPGGRLIVGNFAETHPTRPWIEWCGAWFLIHRTLTDLRSLAASAGIPVEDVNVYADRWGAVGFLDAARPAR